MSLYIYNTFEDIDLFFDELKKIVKNLSYNLPPEK
jgi:selenocysteine lyase/cysteine desulfurase